MMGSGATAAACALRSGFGPCGASPDARDASEAEKGISGGGERKKRPMRLLCLSRGSFAAAGESSAADTADSDDALEGFGEGAHGAAAASESGVCGGGDCAGRAEDADDRRRQDIGDRWEVGEGERDASSPASGHSPQVPAWGTMDWTRGARLPEMRCTRRSDRPSGSSRSAPSLPGLLVLLPVLLRAVVAAAAARAAVWVLLLPYGVGAAGAAGTARPERDGGRR